jgi:hypothetical protein
MEKKIIYISSMGGHLKELLALKKSMKHFKSYIVTEKTDATSFLKDLQKTKNNKSTNNCNNDNDIFFEEVYYLPYGTKKNIFKYFIIFLMMIFKSIYILLKIRPKAIVTTGTHTAVPICYIGKIFGVKIVYIETFANITTKTLAGKIIYPIADKFIVQWESMKKLYPKSEYFGGVF